MGPDGTLWLATNAGLVSLSQDRTRWAKYGSEYTEGVIFDDDQTVRVQAGPPYVLRLLKEPQADPEGQKPALPLWGSATEGTPRHPARAP